MTLGQLRGLDTDGTAEDARAAERASQPGWLTGPAAGAAACDATIVPVVSGHIDPAVLDQLAAALLHGGQPSPAAPPPPPAPTARNTPQPRATTSHRGLAAPPKGVRSPQRNHEFAAEIVAAWSETDRQRRDLPVG